MAENTYQVVLRLDPDNSSSRKGLKRIKLMNNSKNAGNEAFKAGKWREAEQHYTQALEVDAHLKSSFVAQCACNRFALPFLLSHGSACFHTTAALGIFRRLLNQESLSTDHAKFELAGALYSVIA